MILIKKKVFLILISALVILMMAFVIGRGLVPDYQVSTILLDVITEENDSFFMHKGKKKTLDNVLQENDSLLLYFDQSQSDSFSEIDYEIVQVDGQFFWVELKKTYRAWALFPAFVTLLLCWVIREPVLSLLFGVLSGSLILQHYNIIEQVLIPTIMSKSASTIILLYFILLGGLLGMWSITGADQAFAKWMTTHFVKGPRSAKLVSWMLGVLFFQGGTVSVVLVGTMVKPLSDKHKVSHEELAYVVDSTASPIASQLAFNAWPAYIQGFIYVAGVSWLATEADRITFFFKSVPFCFYAIFAVFGTFMLAIGKPIFIGKQMKEAIKRSRETGQLDRPGIQNVIPDKLKLALVPKGYKSSLYDFVLPLFLLIFTAIYTFVVAGSPNILLAFSLSLSSIVVMAVAKGLLLKDIIRGLTRGMQTMVLGLLILLLAICIGKMTVDLGAGIYMVGLLGDSLPYWCLPVCLQILTVIIAFSTGTSWGTYAITFPIAMPLAWAIAQSASLDHPMFFMTICFAAVMDGSVYGDQCSPISDTTVLSSMCTGCDLMDHVKTQLPQATAAAVAASICWTVCAVLFT